MRSRTEHIFFSRDSIEEKKLKTHKTSRPWSPKLLSAKQLGQLAITSTHELAISNLSLVEARLPRQIKSNQPKYSFHIATATAMAPPTILGHPEINKPKRSLSLLGPPELSKPSPTPQQAALTTMSDAFIDLMVANFNKSTVKPLYPDGYTENMSATFLSCGNPCLILM
ncbi:unnamed protein product [Dovyalis caffra]|uniref:Uncharacterized protein n=1 Tax=Dovyalis caffra TaxID=77055 RepID=A0AAV1RIP7_9ROSI|nr:unnamed protein product [Dovyalis caffra]